MISALHLRELFEALLESTVFQRDLCLLQSGSCVKFYFKLTSQLRCFWTTKVGWSQPPNSHKSGLLSWIPGSIFSPSKQDQDQEDKILHCLPNWPPHGGCGAVCGGPWPDPLATVPCFWANQSSKRKQRGHCIPLDGAIVPLGKEAPCDTCTERLESIIWGDLQMLAFLWHNGQ